MSSIKIKKVLRMLLLSAIGIGLVASFAAASFATEISFTYIWPQYKGVMEKSISMFMEEYPEIKVKTNVVPWDEAETHLRTTITGGVAPDAAFMWTMYMRDWVKIGAALDLNPYLDDPEIGFRDWFVPGLLEMAEFNGKFYNIPFKATFPVVFYNKDIFDELGLTPPATWSTWSQMMGICEKIKSVKGIPPFVVQGKGGEYIGWWMRFLVPHYAYEAGVLEEITQGQVPFNGPYVVKAYELIKEVYDKGYWMEGALGISVEESQALFVQEKAAMALGTVAYYGHFKENCDFNFNVMLFPSPIESPEYFLLGGTDGHFVLSTSENPREATLLLRYLASEKIQKMWYDDIGMTPVNKNIKIADSVVMKFVSFSQYLHPHEWWSFSPKIGPYMNAGFAALLEGTKSAQELADELESIRKEALEE